MEFEQLFAKNGIMLSEKQLFQFKEYSKFLMQENQKCNLTAITDIEEIYKKHFLDSLLAHKELRGNEKICDVGAGAGFPSVPLKIMFPNLSIVLFDSVQKKVNFLNELIKKLDLKDCVAVHLRAEDAGHDEKYREKFDIVVARAVAELRVLNEYCLPFVKNGGKFLAYKGSNFNEELNNADKSLKLLNGKILEVLNFSIEDMERHIFVIKKMGNIDKKYPRCGNKPRILPL